MIVSIHQPHFLPWAGYFNKVWNSDVFVWLHNVQYRKNYYQNRTRVKNPYTGAGHWLTVPVRASLGTPIDQVAEADNRWRKSMSKTLEHFYGKSRFFDEIGPHLVDLMHTCDANLDRLNFQFFQLILQKLGYHGKLIRVEELLPLSDEPNQRLIEICRKLNATHYIAGKGGKNYVEPEQWKDAGITIIWQDFRPDLVVYPQSGDQFIPGLSVVDIIFNVGIAETRRLISEAWQWKTL